MNLQPRPNPNPNPNPTDPMEHSNNPTDPAPAAPRYPRRPTLAQYLASYGGGAATWTIPDDLLAQFEDLKATGTVARHVDGSGVAWIVLLRA